MKIEEKKWKTLFPPAGFDPGFSGWKSGILTIRPQELRQKKSKMKEIYILISCLAHMWHTLPKNKLICPKMGGLSLNGIQLKWIIGTHSNWKNQNPWSRFGATCKTALPTQPIYHKNGPNGLNWQCSLAGSSKMAPRILIFLIAMGAKLKFIAT